MAIFGCSLEESRKFSNEIINIKDRLERDESFREKILNQENNYIKIKNYFSNFLRFLRYTSDIQVESIYRVRKRDDSAIPFNRREELAYPPPSTEHQDRMNNTSFRVLLRH